ncbi:ribose-5-phosphate isomerase [Micromonospora fiedleri]|uniref:Ribose-5-phosphate isomerase B n=2 Tax=Micromonospora TaxID=1873 RepID=A0ABS1ULT1_9ACTN|nr:MULTISPECIES: ribose-5-phosphate isomerase [Micromonospora]MBL6277308.1 ribose-5-phosphate isomerase [Micromonospora fiedleri]PMR57640.1 ribose-5-phosphate isomerase [Verrucosispora sp. ts21]WSK42176.1 ribose-5-phosphate isomerase [Micromonospora maris]GIJ18985.1 ribose-5-phosphate isomerase [Micromonospora gifhornensis]
MRVYLGSDHAGFELKVHLANHLAKQGYEVVDVGPHVFDPDDDYPAFCLHAGTRVVADPGSLGVVIGGSGNGEQIAANKVAGVRAALAWSVETAQLGRQHNDANVVAVGARQHTLDEATAIVEAFLTTAFSGSERHARRIAQVADYEQTRKLPDLP